MISEVVGVVSEGHTVDLRAVSKEDLLTLYEWRPDMLDFGLSIGQRGDASSFEQFSGEMSAVLRETTMLLVVGAEDDRPMGLVQAFAFDQMQGSCQVLVYISRECRGEWSGREAGLLFFDYLFRTFRMRKIYIEITEYNEGLSELGHLSIFLEQEGLFRQHKFRDGQYWDVRLLALYRERWNTVRGTMLRLFQIEQDGEETSKQATSSDPREKRAPRRTTLRHRLKQPSKRVKLVHRLVQAWREGRIEDVMERVADDIVFDGQTIDSQGKAAFEGLIRAAIQLARRTRPETHGEDEIAWTPYEEHGTRVSAVGTRGTDSLEVIYEFDTEEKVSLMAFSGAQPLIARYIQGDEPESPLD